ncbi:MAG: PSD1 and planctomycete cytochrome C domain-containing protein [Pirellulales bacterium]
MPRTRSRSLLLAGILVGLACPLPAGAEEPAQLTFEHQIRPLLKTYCLDCHGGGDEAQGQLDLRLVRLLLQGGETGPAIVPGKPEESLLIQRIRDGEMPPGEKKLPATDLALLRRWVAAGAPTARPEPATIDKGIGITPEEREFWAFQPLRRPPLPAWPTATPSPNATVRPEAPRTPIDLFVTAAAQQRGLSLAQAADPATLLRRAALDLTGLPPTLEETAEFVADTSPDAFERQLDRLLASPHYGERWGRHWLDVAGYADSDGYTTADALRPYAYKYRDYVIRAWNEDLPFDQFLLEQLAGDELTGEATTNFTPQQIRWLTATGFLRLAADGTGSGAADQDLARNQVVADTLKIMGSALWGVTLHCAQCHNHRYDPIPQADYYRLRAVFEPALNWKQWRTPQQRLVSLYTDADRAQAAEVEAEAQRVATERTAKQTQYLAAALEKELEKFPAEKRSELRTAYQTPADKRSPAQQQLLKENPSVNLSPGVLYQYDAAAAEDLKKYDRRIEEIRARKPVEDFVQALVEPAGEPPATFVFHRGDHRQPKEPVGPGDLTIAAPPNERWEIPAVPPGSHKSGRRSALARHLTRGDHPLLGRVQVNRFWLHHFGRGLVGTPGDFGTLGERPSHPELLDWLASEWPRLDWSGKQLHRLLMTSAVYRQSSVQESAAMADQDRRLLTRAPLRRLDAEVIRDRLLFVTGSLSTRMFGPPTPVKEDDVGQVIVSEGEPRRSIYVQARRTQPVALLTAFDAPVMETNCERRTSSTVATQSLLLMNGEFVLQQSRALAERARREADSTAGFSLGPQAAPRAAQVAALRRPPAWQYGYGAYAAAAQRVQPFTPLPHWTGGAWQGSPQLPDAAIGWVLLLPGGGHPGHGADRAAIRRWTAPQAGRAKVDGVLQHGQEAGDGVRGRLVSSRSGLLGEWTVHHQQTPTNVAELAVEAGDTLDFVVDCRESENSDTFAWTVTIQLQSPAAGTQPAATRTFVSDKEFAGPPPPATERLLIRAWQLAYGRSPTDAELARALQHVADQAPALQAALGDSTTAEFQAIVHVCQALLTSNEFLYVD